MAGHRYSTNGSGESNFPYTPRWLHHNTEGGTVQGSHGALKPAAQKAQPYTRSIRGFKSWDKHSLNWLQLGIVEKTCLNKRSVSGQYRIATSEQPLKLEGSQKKDQ